MSPSSAKAFSSMTTVVSSGEANSVAARAVITLVKEAKGLAVSAS